jgi:hypothetical protein
MQGPTSAALRCAGRAESEPGRAPCGCQACSGTCGASSGEGLRPYDPKMSLLELDNVIDDIQKLVLEPLTDAQRRQFIALMATLVTAEDES